MYQVLLYYKFVRIDNPELFAQEHLALCKRLELKGRIIIATEGINGTVSGPKEATATYMSVLQSDSRFADIEFKIDEVEGHVFQKIFVRAKAEILTLRHDQEIDPNVKTGKYLSPVEFKIAMESGDAILLDGRSDYEYDLGHFEGAIRPNIDSFRDFPQWIKDNLLDLRDKPILTYCTGGIRCEKLTGLLMEEGFSDVSQLKGGIVTYGKDPEVRGQYFAGKCYVFDERIGVDVNHVDPKIVSACKHCGRPCDRYVNCTAPTCHEQFFLCEACDLISEGFCSSECVVEEMEVSA